MRRTRAGGARPSELQRLLLEAALLDGERALTAWRRWRAAADLDRLDGGSNRLLPQLYRNLVALGVADPELGRLKGLYRHAWYTNQLLFRDAGAALRALAGAGIETLVLKGAAVALLHYRDAGARPMDDVDVLVRPADAAGALDALRDAGWRTGDASPQLRRVRHAAELTNEAGRRIDLHWSSLAVPGPDERFWARSVALELGGAPTRAPAPHDLLLHVCAHGATWHRVAPVRWVADAVKIAIGVPVDWDGLAEHARERRITPGVGEALAYLRDAFGVAVPPAAIERIEAAPTLLRERAAHRAAMTAPGPLRTLLVDWDRYRRMSALGWEGGGRPLGFLSYAQHYRGFERPGELVAHAASRLLGRDRGVDTGAVTARRARPRAGV